MDGTAAVAAAAVDVVVNPPYSYQRHPQCIVQQIRTASAYVTVTFAVTTVAIEADAHCRCSRYKKYLVICLFLCSALRLSSR